VNKIVDGNNTSGRWQDFKEGPRNGQWRVYFKGKPRHKGTLGECIDWRDRQVDREYTLIQEALR
jgi:hypothetical protein